MARANTLEWEGPATWGSNEACDVEGCMNKVGSGYRLFYNPTYMNGDAEMEGNLCPEHYKSHKKAVRQLVLIRLNNSNHKIIN